MALKAKKKLTISDREKIFAEVIDELCIYTDVGLRDIASRAGCHWGTLYAWCAGKVIAPRISTLFPVARALGFEITIAKKRTTLRVVK